MPHFLFTPGTSTDTLRAVQDAVSGEVVYYEPATTYVSSYTPSSVGVTYHPTGYSDGPYTVSTFVMPKTATELAVESKGSLYRELLRVKFADLAKITLGGLSPGAAVTRFPTDPVPMRYPTEAA